jgi:hypothetical protein
MVSVTVVGVRAGVGLGVPSGVGVRGAAWCAS